MKRLLILLLAVCAFDSFTYAQTPQLLNYQGVARNAFGNPIPNRQMTLRLSIRNGNSTGPVVYSETRTVTTNAGGLYTVQIGSGGTIATSGTIAAINWQTGSKFMQVEVDPEAGTNFIDLGTTQLVSVPYALNAGVANPVGNAGGDLSGTFPNPTVATGAINTVKIADAAISTIKLVDQSVTTIKIADNAVTTTKLADASVTTAKLADASVTDAKIVTVSGTKVTGNISGNAANVTGIVALANGGTGATTAAGARTNLGLGLVDNTSDLSKPISTATQAALDLKENISNKSTNTSLGTSDVLYPTQNAVKTYVDGQFSSGAIPDATNLVKGKLQLAGDLTGNAAAPLVANNAITTTKLADASVTDAKIVTVSGSKVTGNISGNAANVTGIVALANGGTGATTAVDARTNLGLGLVDNTSDLSKPISTATQAALDLKENISNKSTNTSLGTSDVLYPTQNAVKTYVDGQFAAGAIPDATNLVKGKLQLAGDLTGTAAAPLVANNAITTTKLADASVTDAKIVTVSGSKVTGNISGNAANVTGIVAIANGGTGATTATDARTNLGLGLVDNTSDLSKPISTATQAALDLKENFSNKSSNTSLGTSDVLYPTQNAVKTYVDGQFAAGAIPDATNLVKGKLQLAGDLTGNAAAPLVANNAITTAKLADASVTDAKIVTVSGTKVTGGSTGQVLTATTNGTATWSAPFTGISGSGTTSYLPKFSSSTALTNSSIIDDGNSIYFKTSDANSTAGSGGATVKIGTKGRSMPANSGTTQNSVGLRLASNNNDVLDFGIGSRIAWLQSTDVLNLGAGYDINLNPIGGNVGIGMNTAPTSKLDVNGNVKAASFNSTIVNSVGSNIIVGQGNVLASLTTGTNNVGVGQYTLNYLDAGSENLGMGYSAMYNTRGSYNVGLGHNSLWSNNSGNYNTAIGHSSGYNSTGSNNTFLGYNSNSSSGLTNATAIGSGATVTQSNTIQLGNTSVINVKTSGTVTAGSVTYPNTAGTNGYYLKTDGSGTATWAAVSTGVASVGAISASSTSNGASITSGVLNLAPADATNGGIITAGAQTIAGDKNYTGTIRGKAAVSSEITADLTINPSNAESYNSKIIICNPTSGPITLTFSSGLPDGFNCMVLQKSADSNKIILSAGTGVSVKNRNNFTSTAGNYALATVVHIGGNIIVTAGDMQ